MTCLDCHAATLCTAAPGGEGKSKGKVSNPVRTDSSRASQIPRWNCCRLAK